VEEEHPNAVDDLSSDESDVEQSYGRLARESAPDKADLTTPAKPASQPSTSKLSLELKKPSLMWLGNNSTPHVNRPSPSPIPSFESVDRKRPISNTPHRASYFSRKKGKSDHSHIPVSTFEFYKQQYSLGTGEPSTKRKSADREAENMRQGYNKQKDKELLQKLDGLLKRHMEAEKDTIKRIASSVKTKS